MKENDLMFFYMYIHEAFDLWHLAKYLPPKMKYGEAIIDKFKPSTALLTRVNFDERTIMKFCHQQSEARYQQDR
ncbi:CLUMA_CG000309, isoform A [Clunio marinus]|uniref:CLUMA_CG000309, isoform A n=1 Tax=Clunio marinus TaxID=568069 RepID=A0A1J1HIP5_9DIPT|nr:CLUMA_CG000309, isoform A [Clunio marinus]